MVNTKDLRDMFDELTKDMGKRASHALDDVNIGRESGTPGLRIFCIGLEFGGLIRAAGQARFVALRPASSLASSSSFSRVLSSGSSVTNSKRASMMSPTTGPG